jgi:uncharacterized lipoprotein YddW (UPF0748 family)
MSINASVPGRTTGGRCDPALPETRSRALSAILDVVRRYDVDGVHLDDCFYPYPVGDRRLADGKTPAQRSPRHCRDAPRF